MMNINLENLGYNLFFIRNSVLKMSQGEICKVAKITPQTVIKYEKGKIEPSLGYVYKLCKLANISFAETTLDLLVTKKLELEKKTVLVPITSSSKMSSEQ